MIPICPLLMPSVLNISTNVEPNQVNWANTVLADHEIAPVGNPRSFSTVVGGAGLRPETAATVALSLVHVFELPLRQACVLAEGDAS